MIDNSNQNGVTAAAADTEKIEDWEEDLEEGEAYVSEDGGSLGKGVRREVDVTRVPDLVEPLLSPEEAQHQELAAASKSFVLTEKLIVCLVIVGFVLAEAYFVGRSFRNWINNKDTYHEYNGTLANNAEFVPMPLPVILPILPSIDAGAAAGKESVAIPEPVDDFLEGSSESRELTVKESLENVPEMSTRMTRLPRGVGNNPQLQLVQRLMEKEEAPI